MTPPALLPAHYANWMPFEAQETASGLSIVCREMPRGEIAVHAGVIATVFCGFDWLTYTRAPHYFGVTLALGIVTLGGSLAHVIWFHRTQQQLGPVLVYDRRSATIGLPRQSRTFREDEVDCICFVTGHAAEDPVCQLQLHTKHGERLALVSGFHGSLDDICNTLASKLAVPVRGLIQPLEEST